MERLKGWLITADEVNHSYLGPGILGLPFGSDGGGGLKIKCMPSAQQHWKVYSACFARRLPLGRGTGKLPQVCQAAPASLGQQVGPASVLP